MSKPQPQGVSPDQSGARTSMTVVVSLCAALAVGAGAAGYFILSTPRTADVDANPTLSDDELADEEEKQEELAQQARIAELVARAEEAERAGKLINPPQENALVFYEQALAIDPTSSAARRGVEGLVQRAITSASEAIASGQLLKAEELIAIVRTIDPSNPSLDAVAQTLASTRAAIEQSAREAQARIQEDLARKVAAALTSASDALIAGRLDAPPGNNALSFFREALKLEPDNPDAQAGIVSIVDAKLDRARVHVEDGEFDAAAALIESAAAIRPDYARIAVSRESLEAKKASAAVDFTAGRIAALLSEAEQHVASGNRVTPAAGNAIRSYQAVLQLDPSNAAATAGIANVVAEVLAQGEVAISEGRIEDAEALATQVDDATKSITAPDIVEARDGFAEKLARARTAALRNEVDALLGSAQSAFAAGRLRTPKEDNALDQYRKVLELVPDNQAAAEGIASIADRYVSLATSALGTGDLELAQEHYFSARQINPSLASLGPLQAQIETERAARGRDAERQARIQAEIATALLAAMEALDDGRLSAPPERSALYYFTKVRRLDPTNDAATAGVADVGRRHVANAYFAITNQRFEAAQAQIQAAEAIDPPPPDLAAVRLSLETARERAAAEELQANLDAKLAAAEAALQRGNLVSTDGTAALDHYQEALALDAGNKVAVEGIRLVFDALLARTRSAINEADFDLADASLDAAEGILANTARVANLRTRITDARAAEAKRAENRRRADEMVAQAGGTDIETAGPDSLAAVAKLYLAAVDLTPGHGPALSGLASTSTRFSQLVGTALSERRVDDARKYLQVAAALFPQAEWVTLAETDLRREPGLSPAQRAEKVTALLRQAERQLGKFYLTTPKDDNATATFKQVLDLDPENTKGLYGFERVVERYMVLAEQKLIRGENSQARRFIALADTVIKGYGESRARARGLLAKLGERLDD